MVSGKKTGPGFVGDPQHIYISITKHTDYLVIVGALACKPTGRHIDMEDGGVKMEQKAPRDLQNLFAWFQKGRCITEDSTAIIATSTLVPQIW
jgi:hypothetical protein